MLPLLFRAKTSVSVPFEAGRGLKRRAQCQVGDFPQVSVPFEAGRGLKLKRHDLDAFIAAFQYPSKRVVD